MTKPRPIHPLLPSLAVLCGSAGFAFPADAQHQQPECNDDEARIVGVIVDAATETPVAGAHASVEASDWGSLTTDNGRFLLCGIAAGIHVVTVERLGYVTLESPIEASASGEPVALPMRPDPVLLEGLEIVSDRF